MAKPKKNRVVLKPPSVLFYKPQGVPLAQLRRVVLEVDEYEAIRLVDKEGLQQNEAAERMDISRATCARILESAHRKIGEALTGGMAIEIAGGSFTFTNNRYRCADCGMLWELPADEPTPDQGLACPACKSSRFTDLGAAIGPGRMMRGRGGYHRYGGGRRGAG